MSAPAPAKPALSPITRRRLRIFLSNKRGSWSLWLFLLLLVVSLFSEFIANDRPILASYKGELLFPFAVDYPESKFGGFLATTNFRDPVNREEIEANGWMLWPPIHYSYDTVDNSLPVPTPAPPSWTMSTAERCSGYAQGVDDPDCSSGNMHWLGTDDVGRDVVARLLYGFRISVLFGFALAGLSSIVGIAVGAISGYFGGWTDLLIQRFIDIWTSVPSLYVLLIISSVIAPSFWSLLIILLLFSWVTLVGLVRAEFLRVRNFEYVEAARALGVSNFTIMRRHLFPNAMVSTLTFLPFILSGSVTTLTALDFLGFGLPPGSPSLGEMLNQAKDNLGAPWLSLSGLITISLMLALLIFIGEAVRDAFDPRKSLA
ncbi:MAG: peptide ABC transporter permease [Devosia sp. 67-54]|uniref:ABC transporter permease n=1 Tax=unclassified Devosia TaxID=196773 RepID=UPI000968BDEF|nr:MULTISPECIES: ABC transporter permease [unclassified Devosia]OJX20001.1 MAG: peptide ABC transporter permease [Devosia sp. 67-54]